MEDGAPPPPCYFPLVLPYLHIRPRTRFVPQHVATTALFFFGRGTPSTVNAARSVPSPLRHFVHHFFGIAS